MEVLNNYLTSGHYFSASENLQKFRFAFLSSLMLLALLGALINSFNLISNRAISHNIFEIALILYSIISLFVMFLLRQNKKYYFMPLLFLFLVHRLYFIMCY